MAEDDVERWNHLYKTHLPQLAKARDPVQKKWPVYLDHCFARIILDNTVGKGRPWTEVVKQPAVKNMTHEQFSNAIALAEQIASGKEDINVLNENSLRFRGKKRGTSDGTKKSSPTKRVKRADDDSISKYFANSSKKSSQPDEKSISGNSNASRSEEKSSSLTQAKEGKNDSDLDAQLKRIADSNLTSFRKQALSLLCQVPRGRYSTYQAMSDFISDTSHKTCARAVGSAMRNNPFAPEVPCHRILASDGTLGGFGGHWGEDGKFANKKHELLYKEGVRFDSSGKVKGPVFRAFSKESFVS